MSWLKLSLVLSTGVLLVGLCNRAALSQEPAPPRDRGDGWDGGPMPGGPAAARRPQPPRDDEDGPPGPPELRDGGGDQRQPPGDARERRPPRPRREDRDRPAPPEGPDGPGDNGPPPPGGPEGDRRQPPGPPPGYLPHGREDFESLKTKDPELFKAIQEDRDLERQTRDQADQYRRANKDQQAKIKANLAEIVNKHFEVRQQLRNLEVKRLEQQLKQLRDKIDQRSKNRKEIVEKRITELTGADEGERF
jgi:hypothetical protein